MSVTDSTKQCVTCKTMKPTAEFHRNPRAKDGKQSNCRDCVSKYGKAYRVANKDRTRIQFARWAVENSEHVREQKRKAYVENREEIKARAKAWRLANLDKMPGYARKFREKHPDKKRADSAARRASLREAEGSYTESEVQRMCEDQGGLCAYCEIPLKGVYHIDHMMPLSRGGNNTWENLAIACPRCNMRKHDRTAEEFLMTAKK